MVDLQKLLKEKEKLERQLAAAIAENKKALRINKELREENIRLKVLLYKMKRRRKLKGK